MKTKIFSALFLVITFFGCDNANQLEQDIDDSSSKSYPVVLKTSDLTAATGCNDNKMEADTLYAVNSREELLALTSCASNISDVNWENQTLLVTWDRRCNADSKVVEKKFEETAENVFRFQVTVEPSLTANGSPLILYTIVPKLPKNAVIGFNIVLQNGGNGGVANLKGTFWKLDGYVNVADGKLTEAEPKDNEQYFTLAFESDSAGKGKTVYRSFDVQLFSNPLITIGAMTDNIYEGGNVNLFYEAIKTVDSYRVDVEGLKFFYNNGKQYLLYKQLADAINKQSDNDLVGKKWKLTGFVYADTETTKVPEPKETACYTIIFKPDKSLTGFSSTNELFGEYEMDVKSSSFKIKQLGGTKINEQYDGKLFVDNLLSVHSFSIENTQLKLYYNEHGDFLFFKNLDMNTLQGEWSWVKTNTGFRGTIIDNEFKSVLKIYNQNEDTSIHYESFAVDTLFFKGTFRFEQTPWTNVVIKIPQIGHGVC